jgi:hypothetical protein
MRSDEEAMMWDDTSTDLIQKSQEPLFLLLKKQCGYYNAILELTRLENDKFVCSRPLNEITPLMKQKKVLLTCIEEVEAVINQLNKSSEPNQEKESPSLAVKEQLLALDVLLKEILSLDEANQKLLQRYMKK